MTGIVVTQAGHANPACGTLISNYFTRKLERTPNSDKR